MTTCQLLFAPPLPNIDIVCSELSVDHNQNGVVITISPFSLTSSNIISCLCSLLYETTLERIPGDQILIPCSELFDWLVR